MDIVLSSLRLAFQSVKDNQGCAGVAGMTIRQFEENADVNLSTTVFLPQRAQSIAEKINNIDTVYFFV